MDYSYLPSGGKAEFGTRIPGNPGRRNRSHSVFSGDHAHYGHRYYGREIHDNFPPSYLSGIEICHALGMKEQAFGMISHLLRFGIDIKGRFYYRQGLKDWNGAAGSEYGRFFCLAARLWKTNPEAYPLKSYAETLARMKPTGWINISFSIMPIFYTTGILTQGYITSRLLPMEKYALLIVFPA